MRLFIRHSTTYRFDDPVSYGLQQLRKTPKSNAGQQVVSWTTEVTGGRCELTFDDHHHNTVDLVSFERDTRELVVVCAGEVTIEETNGIIGRHRGPAPLWLYTQATPRTRFGTGCRAIVKAVGGDTDLARMHNLSAAIGEAVAYRIGASKPDWTAEEAIAEGSGVCQDHAHIFVACAREMGLPARYVSGYLMLDDREQQDATHAWAEAHIDGLGWVGFDVSNGISPDTRYVRVATGLDYAEAAPVTGMRMGGNDEALSVEIQIAQQ